MQREQLKRRKGCRHPNSTRTHKQCPSDLGALVTTLSNSSQVGPEPHCLSHHFTAPPSPVNNRSVLSCSSFYMLSKASKAFASILVNFPLVLHRSDLLTWSNFYSCSSTEKSLKKAAGQKKDIQETSPGSAPSEEKAKLTFYRMPVKPGERIRKRKKTLMKSWPRGKVSIRAGNEPQDKAIGNQAPLLLLCTKLLV